MAFDTALTRDTHVANTNDPLVPSPTATEVIQVATQSSAVMRLARRWNMGTKSQRIPVLSTLPEAYFVSGDTGRKQTSTVDWENVELVAEELAVIVPIAEAYLDDAQVPIWSQVQPLIGQAFGKAFDNAVLWGTNKPSTWGAALSTGIEASNNDFTEGVSGDDFAADLTYVGQAVAKDGHMINGALAAPGLAWRLAGLRATTGELVYQPSAAQFDGSPSLYGLPMAEVLNGAWDQDYTVILGDWTKAIVGVRQDLTYKLFTEGVISDDSGNVVLNLMQQDSVALRAVMRVAWAVADPVTPASSQSDANTFAFGALVSQPT
jgi:HK97 family phage major capsid protein